MVGVASARVSAIKRPLDLNDFFRHLPGGDRRSEEPTERREALHRDLDVVCAALRINGAQVGHGIREANTTIFAAIRNFNNPEFVHAALNAERTRDELLRKLIPAFEAMIRKGYTREELAHGG